MSEEMEIKIQAVADKIAKKYKPKKIIFFGSWVWGKPNKNSDADLFIIKDENKSQIEMTREVDRILCDRDIPVDILVYKTEQLERRKMLGDPFIMKIINSGKILYEC